MLGYDYYNREERAICAHLFRLLHEKLDDKAVSPLGQFINKLSKSNLSFKNGRSSLSNLRYNNVTVFCEAAIIRDAYQNAKPDVKPFMDSLTKLIMIQENADDCRLYSQLPPPLNIGSLTHPKQIRYKAEAENIHLNKDELKVYGAMQGMFNAKPDLVITIDNVLLICEAKLTESFDEEQLRRTWNIADVWASILFADFGFLDPPIYSVFKLGGAKLKPHINWSDIFEIANNTYSETDRTRIALHAGLELMKRNKLEAG